MDKLKVKKELEKRTDNIIMILNDFVNTKGVKNALSDNRSKIGKSQLNNLLRSVRQASSVEELKLLISYKEAKEYRGNGWATNCEGKSLSQQLNLSIKKVEEIAKEIGDELSLDDIRELKLQAVEKFLGYLYWKGTEIANS